VEETVSTAAILTAALTMPLDAFKGLLVNESIGNTSSFAQKAFEYSQEKLATSVANGQFTERFRDISVSLGANETANVNVLQSEASGLVLFYPPTASPTVQPSRKAEERDASTALAAWMIALIAVGGAIVVLLFVLFIFWQRVRDLCRSSKKQIYADVEANTASSPQPQEVSPMKMKSVIKPLPKNDAYSTTYSDISDAQMPAAVGLTRSDGDTCKEHSPLCR
jgi:hypothetical protein